MNDKLPPVHPGEVLMEDFMWPLNLSISDVARALGVQPITISLITRGKRAVSAEMAIRLARWTKVDAQVWLCIQAKHDKEVAEKKFGKMIEKLVIPLAQAA